MGKAIYKPVGKAGEYAKWACNYYLGCSNDCDYCYCKQGVLGTVAGGKTPVLKACFKNTMHAFETFMKEMMETVDGKTPRHEIIKKEGGLFFSFTSDPMLPETKELTLLSVAFATGLGCPCQILTKCTEWMDDGVALDSLLSVKDLVAVGFTLTGMDEMERGITVASNTERLKAMKKLHSMGVKTFASFEPIIEPARAAKLFILSRHACDLYKFGTLSGKHQYDIEELNAFVEEVNRVCERDKTPVYWKKSIRTLLGGRIEGAMCVDENWPLFSEKS
jgi:DNA repair photolyase